METNKSKNPCRICARVGASCNYDSFKKCRNDDWSQFTNSRPDGIIPDDIMEILEPKSKHPGGRPPKFKTPEELAEKAEGYFQYCDEHPVRIYKRKNAGASQTAEKGSGVKQDEGEMYVDRPYTKDGLALWIGVSDWHDMKDSECYQTPEFIGIIHALETRIRNQQVTGGMCGVYHPNLTARLNGIAENINADANVNIKVVDFGDE